MATKHFFKGLVAFLSLIILGLVIFSLVNKYGNGLITGTDAGDKAEVAK